ncbi:divergent PAP2 family protein [Alicyclobacillus cycloheptanicus]|uniref:Acid phosphatase family membrane protein YuiD n=1 Tax=Alicyclobacillus cycloheptanicus TaxID=1457 RepID=A0ABT9XF95_9BACL|nr:divergent PAP2 family protein [Alicyclobacillus cycloheptanicus]MDQ0188795.1 acid phosphatase family membrane protein YuiD [Alicyclobacillus cycloheptanicus]
MLHDTILPDHIVLRDSSYIWIGPLVAMVVAQILKPIIIMIQLRRFDWARMRQSGGMPSSHTALVVALVTELWLRAGGRNPILAIAIFIALIVMYDAAGVRWQTGRQAAVLNRLLNDLRGHALRTGEIQQPQHRADGAAAPPAGQPSVPQGQNLELNPIESQSKLKGLQPIPVVKLPWFMIDWPVLNEQIGHKPIEVIGGCVVGIGVALYLH